MNLRGEPAQVGRHCGSNEYTIDAARVEAYRDALEDRSPGSDPFAPPLLLHSECYEFLAEWYLPTLVGNLHAQQDWELYAPIPLGTKVRTRSTIVDRYQKRGRDYVVNETDVMSVEGSRLLVRGRTHQSFLPPKAPSEEPKAVVPKRSHPPFPVASGRDLEPAELTMDEHRCWLFSGPKANYHNDREEARKLGFPNIVVQGMLSTCLVSRVMQQAFGMGWLEGGRMSVKLTSVVWVDERLRCHARVRETAPEGTRERAHCDVWVEKDDGTRSLIGGASALS